MNLHSYQSILTTILELVVKEYVPKCQYAYTVEITNRPGFNPANSLGCSTNTFAINWLIDSVSQSVILFLKIFKTTPKPLVLGTWNFDTMFNTSYVSRVTYQMSCLTCVFFKRKKNENKMSKEEEKKRIIWWTSLVDGLLTTGPTPPSFLSIPVLSC